MEGVTKNPKKVEAMGKKGYQARLLKLKEQILADTSAGTNTATNTGTTGTNPCSNTGSTPTTPGTSTKCITTDVYMYGVGSLAILAVGLCVFYTFKGKEKVQLQQAENKQTKKFRPTL